MSNANNNNQMDDGNESDYTDTYPADWPENKRKLKPGTQRKVRFKRGETYAEFLKRRTKETRDKYNKKKKEELEAMKMAGDEAINIAKEAWKMEDSNPFITKVVGAHNFDEENPVKKYKKCGNAVKLRLCINQVARKEHVESKKPMYVDKEEWEIGFHIDPDRVVGEAGTIVHKDGIRNLPVTPWLIVKKSNIENAGLGLFADRDFDNGQIIGMYLGGKTGEPGFTIRPHWKHAQNIHCYSFSSSECMGDRSARTMGIQMCNDPNYGLKNAPKNPLWNIKILRDMFVIAIKDIKQGDELLADYQMASQESDMEKEDKDESDNNNSGDHSSGKKQDEEKEGSGEEESSSEETDDSKSSN